MVSFEMTSGAGFDTLYTRAGEFRTLTFYVCGGECRCDRKAESCSFEPCQVKKQGTTYGIGTRNLDPGQVQK